MTAKLKFCVSISHFIIFLVILFCGCSPINNNDPQKRKIAEATQRVGEEQYRSGNFTAALKSLLEAEKTLSDSPYLYNSLGLVYLAKNRPDMAEKNFIKALTLKPDYVRAQNNLGGAYMQQKKWDLAIKTFQEVASNLLYATPEMPLSNLGWVYYYRKHYSQAEFYFNKAIEIRPNFINAIHGLVSVYLKKHNYSKAINYLNLSLKKNPSAAILHADLARTYEAMKKTSEAINSWNVVIHLVPEQSPLGQEARDHILKLKK